MAKSRIVGQDAGWTAPLLARATLLLSLMVGCAATPGPSARPVVLAPPERSGAAENRVRAKPPPPAPAPLPSGLFLPRVRLHLQVEDALDPDALRSLARAGTTAWVQTQSNMLRESTVEALGGFEAVFIQVRPPFLETHLRQLRRLPRAGLWFRLEDAPALRLYRLGPRPVVVEGRGELNDARVAELERLRPFEVHWEGTMVPGTRSALEALRARKVIRLEGEGSALACTGEEEARARSLEPVSGRAGRGLWLARIAETPDALERLAMPACGMALRVRLLGPPSDAGLARLFSLRALSELEVELGPDPEDARAVRRLQQRLEAAQAPRLGVGASSASTPEP
jgi:hypothetical protein